MMNQTPCELQHDSQTWHDPSLARSGAHEKDIGNGHGREGQTTLRDGCLIFRRATPTPNTTRRGDCACHAVSGPALPCAAAVNKLLLPFLSSGTGNDDTDGRMVSLPEPLATRLKKKTFRCFGPWRGRKGDVDVEN
jgi:hypothetical protein